MNEDTNLPQSDQERYINMMPDYGEMPTIEEFRVGFGRRLGAAVLDFTFYMIIFLFALFIFGIWDIAMGIDWTATMSNPGEMEVVMTKLSLRITPLTLAIGTLYYSMEVFFAATLGKMILGIKIGSADRHQANMMQLLIRFVTKNASYLFTALYLLTNLELFTTLGSIIGIIVLAGFFLTISQSKMALHDRVAGTAVFYRDEFID